MKVYDTPSIRSVALVGHGGCGKTSLVSAMLFDMGAVNRLGRVDDGTTATDFDPDEIERRISLQTALAWGEWRKIKLNLIDAPGYAAFFAEAQASLRVADAALLVVDSVAGEDPLMGVYGFLWQADLKTADAIFRQGLTSRIITAKYGALAMMPAKRGLIVEVTENDMIGGGGNPMAQAVKMAQKVLPLLWAAELAPHGIAVMAVTPGFLRSESMLQHFGVTEDNWREAGKKDPNFLQSESPLFVGRAIAALAADPKVQDRTGMLFGSWELGRDYGLTDYDGRRPDWGRHKIDFSVLPPTWIDLFRTGSDLEIKWLTTLAARTKKFRAKIPS